MPLTRLGPANTTTTSRYHWRASLALSFILAGLLVLFSGRFGSLKVERRTDADRGFLRVACTQPVSPDPQWRNYTLTQYNQFMLSLWEPLVECDPVTGQPRPAAAESWQWSPDQLTVTVRLRANGRWSNGDPVVAGDFVRSWLRLLKQNPEFAEILAPLKNVRAFLKGQLKAGQRVGVYAIDDHTLQIDLEKPRSTLMMELADPVLSPLHKTNGAVFVAQSYFKDTASLITNGPFRLLQANDNGYRMEANSFYWDAVNVKLQGLQFVRADGPSVGELMLAAGIVDFLAPTPPGKARGMLTDRAVVVKSEFEPTVNSININTARPPLGDVRVRQALALALNREASIEAHDPGHLIPAWSWVPEMPGRAGLTLLKEDPVEARRLLAAAGYPGGRGFPVLQWAMMKQIRPNRFANDWAEHWFRELGVRTYITYEDSTEYEHRMKAGDYDLSYSRITATVPDAGDLLGVFTWPVEMTGTNWSNQEVTEWLASANAAEGTEHLALLEKVERRVMSELCCVPVMFERRQTMLGGEVRGWYADPLSRQNFKRLYLESDL